MLKKSTSAHAGREHSSGAVKRENAAPGRASPPRSGNCSRVGQNAAVVPCGLESRPDIMFTGGTCESWQRLGNSGEFGQRSLSIPEQHDHDPGSVVLRQPQNDRHLQPARCAGRRVIHLEIWGVGRYVKHGIQDIHFRLLNIEHEYAIKTTP